MLSRLRAAWRAAREVPVLRAIVAGTDRVWWARVIRAADVVDLDYVAAVLGRRLSARKAVRRYVRGGFRDGLTLNPLMHEATVSGQLSDQERVPALYAYLVNDRTRIRTSPNWDAVAYARRVPACEDDPAGPLGHVWRHRDQLAVPLGDGAAPVEVPWRAFRERALAAAAEARTATTASHGGAPTDAETTAVVAVTADGAADALSVAAELTDGARVVVAVQSRRADDWTQAALLPLWRPVTQATLGAHAYARALRGVTAGTLVARGPDADIPAADLRVLASEGARRPVAPLWLAPDGTLASAGLVGDGLAPAVHLLAGHPVEDAQALGEVVAVSAPAGTTFARPADGSGRPATLTRLTVTAPADGPSPAADVPVPADLDALLSAAGFERADGPAGVRRAARIPDGGPPQLRWALKTAAPAGRKGESWGDTHFARGIADALRRAGQEAVVDARPAARRPTSVLDDVSLVLRGPHRIRPPRATFNVLWVISHPDEITADELADFDLVFAASRGWAERASARFDRVIEPLLQCTDVHRFRPTGAARTDDVVFVGTARGIARPSVVEPVRAGVAVKVYGPDWTGYIPARNIAAPGIPNAELPLRYETAGVVLNDHWPAMRREGFIANRPYDVVAAGGRVISDHVDGIDDVFEGAVATYRTTDELVRMLQGDLDALFPAPEEMARIAGRIRAEDSFDARAARLLAAVTAARR